MREKVFPTQVERRRAIVTEPPAAKTQAAKPFTILGDITETSLAFHQDRVIDYVHTAPGRIVGTLAFNALRDCPIMRDGDAEHSDVKSGQVMYYDGDDPVQWQGKEEEFGLLMWCSKITSVKAG
ncbi:hypothetical protein LTR35_017864 [Friedmanniomyces endolithicus]|uniref:Uncharacterized protein n=1 Tax=Friedmanniomyces endolithicus TaxID=329885 RepID=A0AAN6F5I3_9PEZI|nr:hypothetical protein LTR35_017864 [Friedmanniomyces endolithicus]KAK0267289.1 hypothetical protein LTS00_017835 [Friedmanniomyces endolithicus]KAK0303351.1 hypothetical protein LTR82_017574 [Friedmanniomyces endolithicus]KAK0970589.1 hypothetical protein LTR54_017934 [Friedmanniomyces endolithicus]